MKLLNRKSWCNGPNTFLAESFHSFQECAGDGSQFVWKVQPTENSPGSLAPLPGHRSPQQELYFSFFLTFRLRISNDVEILAFFLLLINLAYSIKKISIFKSEITG